MNGPFHVGEQWVQRRAGVRDKAEQIGTRMIRSVMPEQHRELFAQLPAILLGAVDNEGQPHASIVWGEPGFAWSPHPALLCVEASVSADDPLAPLLQPQAAVGLLGLEMPTRRRNRLNGRVVERDEQGFSIAVAQSFGNCPKYIQAREWQSILRPPGLVVEGDGLDGRWLALVDEADTVFIASQSPDASGGGADVSHRGGTPGFVRYGVDGRLWMPDYSGNQLFNTLGNLTREPRCGLLFIDFENGHLLQLQARAELVWPEHYAAFNLNPPPGAERMLALTPGRWTLRYAGLPLSFSPPEASPFLPREGV